MAREVLAAGPERLPVPGPRQLRGLLELAAQGEAPPPRAARWLLTAWRLRDPLALTLILQALREASGQAREAAGGWLFWPPADDELPLRRQLLDQADALLDLARAQPEPWLEEGLAEVLGQGGGAPLRRLLALAGQHAWARRMVSLLPPGLRLPGGWPPGPWLAKNKIGPAGVGRVRRLVKAGRWPELASLGPEELSLAQHLAGDAPAAVGASPLAWPAGPAALNVLQEMARITVAEGLAAARIAARVSERLGRVVLLMGNASLGGPPLWAAPGPWQQGLSASSAGRPRPPRRQVQNLARLRARRLGGEHLLRCLWELRTAVNLAGRGRGRLRELTSRAAPWLEPVRAEALAAGQLGLALGGTALTTALRRAEGAITRCQDLEKQARGAINLIFGLAASGGAPLVLPWVDKFVASTAKAADHVYLAELTALLARLEPAPLLLLIDETVHPGFPSLGRVLQEAGRLQPDLVFKGVGSFGGRPQPGDLGRAVARAAQSASLVAFRPLPGPHPEGDLAQAALGEELRPLTPASRDGAAWLLAGSALAGLGDSAAPARPDEPLPWLLTEQGFAPLGAWLRGKVASLSGRVEPQGRFWRRYQRLCGLD